MQSWDLHDLDSERLLQCCALNALFPSPSSWTCLQQSCEVKIINTLLGRWETEAYGGWVSCFTFTWASKWWSGIWTWTLEGSWTPKPGPWLAAPASMPPLKFRLLSSFPGIQGSCRLDGLLWSSCQGRPPPDSCSGFREPIQGEEVFLCHPLSLREEPEEPRGSWDTDVEFLAKWAPF